MKVSITFRGLQSTEAIKTHIDEKMKRLEKFDEKASQANVVLVVEGYRHIAEIHYHAKQFRTDATAQTDDMYASIDQAVATLEKNLRKHHDKMVTQKSHG